MSDEIDTANKFFVSATGGNQITVLRARVLLDGLSQDDAVNLIAWTFALLDHEHQAKVPDHIRKVLST